MRNITIPRKFKLREYAWNFIMIIFADIYDRTSLLMDEAGRNTMREECRNPCRNIYNISWEISAQKHAVVIVLSIRMGDVIYAVLLNNCLYNVILEKFNSNGEKSSSVGRKMFVYSVWYKDMFIYILIYIII